MVRMYAIGSVRVVACFIAFLAASSIGASANSGGEKTTKPPKMTMAVFLDRLMMAESGGRDLARNPRSTAVGPFQFIESTFLSVMRNHFPKRVEKLTPRQILALRTNREIARDAAKAYTQDNAAHLVANGHKATFPHLRLAFLLGAGGAVRILDAKPETSLAALLGPRVIRANPFMARLTAHDLVARSAADISTHPGALAGLEPKIDPKTGKPIRVGRRGPRIRIRCNLSRPSCRRWLALKRRRMARKSKRHIARRR